MDIELETTRHHVHDHTGITTCEKRHCHLHPGTTGIGILMDNTHYHEIIGRTTYIYDHFHTYCANTGPAISLPGGAHTHYTSFTTSYDSGHHHKITGFVMPVEMERME